MIPRSRFIFFLISFFIGAGSATASSDKLAIFSTFEFFSYSEPTAVAAFASDWDKPVVSGDAMSAFYWSEVGIAYQGWGASRIWREHYYMRFSPETARFYYLTTNKLPLQTAEPYNIDLRVTNFAVTGQRFFGRIIDISGLKVTLGLSLLDAYWLYDGSLTGSIDVLSETDYNFDNLKVDYFYSRDLIFERDISRPSGRGRAFDLRVDWQPSTTTTWSMNIKDMAASIRWNHTPRTNAILESDNKSYDDQGYVRIDPTLRGRHSFETFTQKLPWFAEINAVHQLTPKTAILFNLQHNHIGSYPSTGLSRLVSSTSTLSIHYSLKTEGILLGWHNRFFGIQLGLSDPDVENTKFAVLKVDLTVPVF